MMGRNKDTQEPLFSYNVSLDARIRKDHLLRKLKQYIDFDFIYDEVERSYGEKGRVSVPPPVILKMMLLVFLYDVRSERELMETIPERMDWLWFLGYTLDDEVPNHSVLSKARARWGVDAFRSFFEQVVWQCVQAGLVEGSKLFVDASLIDANASNNSVMDRQSLQRYLDKRYLDLEERLEDNGTVNARHISTTDPDACLTRHGGTKSKLRYKTHRGVDGAYEVITATTVTAGSVDDGKMLDALIVQHEENTQHSVDTVVADSKYGITENYLNCHDRGIAAHIPSLEETHRGKGRQKDIFPLEAFRYDEQDNVYICPSGQILKLRHIHEGRRSFEYQASAKICKACVMKDQCTKSKAGRTVKRHMRHDELEAMRARARSAKARRDIKRRQDLSERSFARSTRYGFKRSRWRRLWRMQIQDYLIAAIQNIIILLKHAKDPQRVAGKATGRKNGAVMQPFSSLFCVLRMISGETLATISQSFTWQSKRAFTHAL